MHGTKNVPAPALDRPIGAVETVCLAVRLKRPEVRGDQRVLQARPISNDQARIAALSTGEMRRTIDAREVLSLAASFILMLGLRDQIESSDPRRRPLVRMFGACQWLSMFSRLAAALDPRCDTARGSRPPGTRYPADVVWTLA
jgi:hypothetical protein